MCIVCNCDTLGDDFLTAFHQARHYMGRAASLMLECSKRVSDPEAKRSYDRSHKHMRRVLRDWNRTEEMREQATTPHAAP